MESYLNLFTTREQAIIVWIAVFLVWALLQKNIRMAIFGLSSVFLQKQIVVAFFTMFLYVALIVFLFYQIRLWDVSLLKGTIFWLFGTAFVLFMNLNRVHKDDHYFRKIVLDNLKLVLVLVFIINFYTLHLLVELILVPVLFIIIAMSVLAGTKEGYAPVKKLANFILGAWGIFLFAFIFLSILNDYQNLLTTDNLRIFLLPLYLTLAFLPFLYGFTIFMAYESIFVRLNISIGKKDEELLRIAKCKMFYTFGFNLGKLNKFSKENTVKLWGLKNEKELREIISQFKKN